MLLAPAAGERSQRQRHDACLRVATPGVIARITERKVGEHKARHTAVFDDVTPSQCRWLMAEDQRAFLLLSHVLEGRPVGLGASGQIHEAGRLRHAVSDADLNEALRAAGLDELSGARLIVLEPSGKISVLKDR